MEPKKLNAIETDLVVRYQAEANRLIRNLHQIVGKLLGWPEDQLAYMDIYVVPGQPAIVIDNRTHEIVDCQVVEREPVEAYVSE